MHGAKTADGLGLRSGSLRDADGDEEPDLRGYISRRRVAEMLEMSVSGVRKFEDSWFKGQKIKHRNTTYYPRRVVDEMLAARGDRKAGVCFAAFRAGRSPSELIASSEDLKPRLVQLYFELYLEIRRAERGVVVVDIDPETNATTWLTVHGFGGAPPSAQYVRAALEYCALIPDVHQKIQNRARIAEERLQAGRGPQ
jgi:hypothetical protein